MSEDSSKPEFRMRWPHVPWGPLAGVLMVLFCFAIVQQISAVLIVYAPRLLGFDSIQVDNWLVNSASSSFVYVVLAEALTMTALLWFLRYKRVSFGTVVGLGKWKWKYAGQSVLGYIAYFLLFLAILGIARVLLPIDLNQEQALGFQQDGHMPTIIMAFISLVVLPPLVEEVLFRGFFYGTLRSGKMRAATATIITSLIFATLHLFGSADGGLLWIAAIDTCILSVVLCFIRERTGSIWACIGLHAIKNGIVFLNLFILGSA